jgi:hypothetical protein
MWRRTVDCLGVAVRITSRVDELEATLGALFHSYADAPGAADLAYDLELADWPQLVRDGEVAKRCEAAIDLVAVLELDLYRQVMARADGLLLHAGAVVGAGGAALIFAGRSGAGKSTLVRALLALGFRYLTEECVALRLGGTCLGLARSLHVDDDAVPVPAGFIASAYPIRRPGGIEVTRLLQPPEPMIWRGPARAVALVAIEHEPGAVAALEPLSGGAALAALWPAVFRPDGAAVADAARVFEGAARFRLRTASPDEAIERALALAAELGVERG